MSAAARKVPFFNYPFVFKTMEEQFVSTFRDVGSRGAFIMQKDLAEFEKNLAAFCGAKYAVGVANATDGLQIAFQADGIGRGDEVIFCTHTMVATASAIHYAGATPVPVDVGPDHLINAECIEKSITPRTKAIMPTQLNGRTADMKPILEIAKKHGLKVFEDAAQALGSRWNGVHAGTFGVASCISFYPAKLLGCLGDGGAVLTNDDKVYRNLLLLRDHGRDPQTGDVVCWGHNTRLDNLQAAFLDFQLKTYGAVIERRREMAQRYQGRLGDLAQVVLPPAPDKGPHFDVYQNYEIEAEDRDALKVFLAERGVGTLIQWGGKAVHQFEKLGFKQSLPLADRMFKLLLMIPMNMSLSNDDVDYVCDQIVAFYRR